MQQAIRSRVENMHRALPRVEHKSITPAGSESNGVCSRFCFHPCEHLVALLVDDRNGPVALAGHVNCFAQFGQSHRHRLRPNFDIGELLQFPNVDNRNGPALAIRDESKAVVLADDDIVPSGAGRNLRCHFQTRGLYNRHAAILFVAVVGDPHILLIGLYRDARRLDAGIKIRLHDPAARVD